MRIQKLKKCLSDLGVDAVIIAQQADLFYLTGLTLSAGLLFVSKEHAWLVVDSRYFEIARSTAKHCTVVLKKTMPLCELLQQIDDKNIVKIGYDSVVESVAQLVQYKHELAQFRKSGKDRNLPSHSLVPLSRPLAQIRAVKDASEIKKIKASCDLCIESFKHILKYIREGVSENELARELKLFWLQQGADRPAFDPIIAFSKNSSMPHYRTQKSILKKGDIILIDIGVVLDGYCSDMTRMASFGVKNRELRKIFSIVKDAQAAAVKRSFSGTGFAQLDAVARDMISAQGYGDYFLHSLGHGLGLDIHEWPTIRAAALQQKNGCDQALQEGMCITIEPGIYLPRLGGVRIEDTILITKSGPQILTNCSRDLHEVC